jgi:hypothetical protein
VRFSPISCFFVIQRGRIGVLSFSHAVEKREGQGAFGEGPRSEGLRSKVRCAEDVGVKAGGPMCKGWRT